MPTSLAVLLAASNRCLRYVAHSGTHIDCIGNHHREGRECDSDTVVKSRVFVDSRANVLNEAGEFLLPIKEGVFSPTDVVAELSEMTKDQGAEKLNKRSPCLNRLAPP